MNYVNLKRFKTIIMFNEIIKKWHARKYKSNKIIPK